MVSASIEVSGPRALEFAGELRGALISSAGEGERVSAVDVERSPELVIAVIGLVFSGVSTAKTIWDWWTPKRTRGIAVTITLEDGSRIDLSGITQERLAIELTRQTSTGT